MPSDGCACALVYSALVGENACGLARSYGALYEPATAAVSSLRVACVLVRPCCGRMHQCLFVVLRLQLGCLCASRYTWRVQDLPEMYCRAIKTLAKKAPLLAGTTTAAAVPFQYTGGTCAGQCDVSDHVRGAL